MIDRLVLELRARKPREGQIFLGELVERVHLVADRGDEAGGFLEIVRIAAANALLQHLRVELDRADGIPHLVRDLERQSPDRRHALGDQELLLRRLQARQRALELRVQTLDLLAAPALALGDVSERDRGEPAQRGKEEHRRPADPGRHEPRGQRVERAGGERGRGRDPGPEVIGIDGDERKEERVVKAITAAGEQEQHEDQTEVDPQRAEEDRARRGGLHGDEREHAELVRGEPEDERDQVDAIAGTERDQPDRRESADHGDGQQDREDALVTLEESKDGLPGFSLGRRHPG